MLIIGICERERNMGSVMHQLASQRHAEWTFVKFNYLTSLASRGKKNQATLLFANNVEMIWLTTSNKS